MSIVASIFLWIFPRCCWQPWWQGWAVFLVVRNREKRRRRSFSGGRLRPLNTAPSRTS